MTSCRPNKLWELMCISITCLTPGSLGTLGSCISAAAVALGIGTQVPGTVMVRRFLCLEEFNHHFAAHTVVRVKRTRFIYGRIAELSSESSFGGRMAVRP